MALYVLYKNFFGVVDKDAGGDVHGIDEAEALADAAFSDQLLDGMGDIDKAPAAGDFKPEMFGE